MATETARLIGGPRSLQRMSVRDGAKEIMIIMPAVGPVLGYDIMGTLVKRATSGVYRKLDLVSPPVFIWQGWKA